MSLINILRWLNEDVLIFLELAFFSFLMITVFMIVDYHIDQNNRLVKTKSKYYNEERNKDRDE